MLEYWLLLPRGRHSSQSDIAEFLATLDVSHDSFQIGLTKVGRLLHNVVIIVFDK